MRKLVLPHTANSFSIDFSEIGFSPPPKRPFEFKLTGFNEEWVLVEGDQQATFTNLSPGTYTFHVRSAFSNRGENQTGASLEIIIRPPWWRTSWMIAFYALLLIATAAAIWRAQVRRLRLQHELDLRQVEAQKWQELDGLKSKFFANISHEFRTPLTLIIGPVEQFLAKTRDSSWRQKFDIVLRNARQLQNLINQLLDFSKLEAGRLTLQARETEIVSLLKKIVASFMSLAERKNISLRFTSSDSMMSCYVDHDKFEKIIVNLLSNAFKYTPDDGRISVAVQKRETNDHVDICISDSGPGIPLDQQEQIFDRFYQGHDAHSRVQHGTGIGLAFVRELVLLHHGEIHVQSPEGEGATFCLSLPLGTDHLGNEEIIHEKVSEAIFEPNMPDTTEIAPVPVDQRSSSKKNPMVLVVEDNSDVRFYVRDILTPHYFIKEAENGAHGFEIAIKKIPDLIISDVMMPVMDGFELCEKLKTDERTSHIPVILLTARASDESKITGLETGADDYIVKPFNARELSVRVQNLIMQRQRLREKFSKKFDASPQDVAVTSLDEQFLARAIDIIEQNMRETSFDTTFLANSIGLSRMQLHRKIKALTDLSTAQFILTIRLRRAAALIQQKAAPITQIAYDVGFHNPSYFTACFRKEFGVPPLEYLKRGDL